MASPTSTEYRGFVIHTLSSLVFLLYFLWSSLPASTLESLHIYYYPSRWWSLAIPAWLVMALIFIYIFLALYNIEYATKPLQSLTCLSDEFSILAIREALEELPRSNGTSVNGHIDLNARGEYDDQSCMSAKERNLYKFLFSPSDGVWDLPINDVCNVLYGEEDTEDGL